MSSYRVTLVALATLLTVGMTSIASACCGWGYPTPVEYAPVAPVTYGGCGTCASPTAAAVYAQPVAPAPIVVNAPALPFGGPCCNVGYNGCGNCGGGGFASWNGGNGWGGGCGNCGGCCARTVSYAAPSPLYVVNQGPDYSGPGLMQPYATYAPDTAYAPATDYPYVPGYGYGPAPVPPPYYSHLYYRPHYASRAPLYVRPRYYAPARSWRHYP
jgi:hypothetical protein